MIGAVTPVIRSKKKGAFRTRRGNWAKLNAAKLERYIFYLKDLLRRRALATCRPVFLQFAVECRRADSELFSRLCLVAVVEL